MVRTLEELGLSRWLAKTCGDMGIRQATPIQQEAIPCILSGKHVLARAKTGSGKTAAFALPILERLAEDPYGLFAIVLTPARELALQIADQFRVFGVGCNVNVAVVIGGQDVVEQAITLERRPHIVVATPGRLCELIRGGTELNMDEMRFLVFDEADRLLMPEFEEDVKFLLDSIPNPPSRQTLLFSATIASSIEGQLGSVFNCEFETVVASSSEFETVDTVDQRYCFMPEQVKDSYLVCILNEEKHANVSTIIFVSTRAECQILSETLLELSIANVSLHSGLSQGRRLASLGKFKSSQCKILVATDVVSRGLDIPEVELVINYDIPHTPTDYIHRIGRTARAGRLGRAISLVNQYEIDRVVEIENLIGKKLELFPVDDEEAAEVMKKANPARRMAKIRLEEYLLKSRKLRVRTTNTKASKLLK